MYDLSVLDPISQDLKYLNVLFPYQYFPKGVIYENFNTYYTTLVRRYTIRMFSFTFKALTKQHLEITIRRMIPIASTKSFNYDT